MDRVLLPDGKPIDVRPLEAEDRTLLAQAAARLSPDSIYRRFMIPMHGLSEDQITYLTNVDHDRHEALVASDPATGEAIAFARYVVVCGVVPVTAEVAMTVLDAWQERGVGSLMLARLAELAAERGIARFSALMLGDNIRMAKLMRQLGPIIQRRADGATLELTVSLAESSAPAGERDGASPPTP